MIEHKKQLFHKYGTTKPENEEERIWNPKTKRYEVLNVKVFMDDIYARVKDLEKQKQIEECRRYNLLVRDLEYNGIKVRRR
jgi:hypothetical protein